MAVVQISRIQHRRGKANTGTGFPQLASGELGWAVDSQELYIGNGSVSEGAPAVGNTKILTQNDLSATGNLLQQLKYIYKVNDSTIITGPSSSNPVSRPIQERLDDIVTLNGFITATDIANNDYTVAIQRAVNQLFLNSNGKASLDSAAGAAKRIALLATAGIYPTTGTIFIPSYATIKGAGRNKTIISYSPKTITGSTTNTSTVLTTTAAFVGLVGNTITGAGIQANTKIVSIVPGTSVTLSLPATSTQSNISFVCAGPAVRFVNDTSTYNAPSAYLLSGSGSINTTATNQPRFIDLSDLTVYTNTADQVGMVLDAVRDSVFENILVKGEWANTLNESSRGLEINSFSTYYSERNLFKNVNVDQFTYGAYSKRDILNNSFIDGQISNAIYGVALGKDAAGVPGEDLGSRETFISGFKFSNIKRHALLVSKGTGNTIVDCKLTNVGNDGAGPANPVYPQIYFDNPTNQAMNIISDRTDVLSSATGGAINVPYLPEVTGRGTYKLYGTKLVMLTSANDGLAFILPVPTTAFGTPINSISYEIEYMYRSTQYSFTRSGKITITADITSILNSPGLLPVGIQTADDYVFAGTDSVITGTTTTSTAITFTGKLRTTTGTLYTGAGGQVPGSIGVFYTNSLASDSGTFYYTYTAVF